MFADHFWFRFVKDKTFGLKNKKGAKQQKFIQQVQKQVSTKGVQNKPRDVKPENNMRTKRLALMKSF